jgi:hypothetical protein
MRVYYVQLQNKTGEWITGAKRFVSCKKAHTAARAIQHNPARVLMIMEKSNLKVPA